MPQDDRSCCMYHGISVLRSLGDAIHQRNLFPKLGKIIAKANLEPTHGKPAPTPARRNPGHHTWWPFEDVERHSLFVVQDE